MKKLLVMALLLFFVSNCDAQDTANDKTGQAFTEWNFGAAYIDDEFIFPGTSFLWGKTYINENDVIVEYEVGIALPSLATAKVGIGKQFHNTKVVTGIRPFPFHFFLQSSFTNGKRGYWIASVEYNPLDSESALSFGSRAIFNVGYRWTIKN